MSFRQRSNVVKAKVENSDAGQHSRRTGLDCPYVVLCQYIKRSL